VTGWTERRSYPVVDARAGLGDPLMARCERDGSRDALSHHHRRKRSHGGGHAPSNIVLLCVHCHDWAEGHATTAQAEGWVLGPADDPLVVPVSHHPMQMRVRLDDDGFMTPVGD
jgi:5-methylcytosine-specific restriction endonuclease McrA